MNVVRPGPTIPRRQIFEELNTGAGTRPHPGDAKMRAEYLVQMLLLRSEVFTLARFAQSEKILIELQTRICIRDPDGSVIDAEK